MSTVILLPLSFYLNLSPDCVLCNDFLRELTYCGQFNYIIHLGSFRMYLSFHFLLSVYFGFS